MDMNVLNKIKRYLKRAVQSLIYKRNESYWYRRDLSIDIPDLHAELPIDISLNNSNETVAWLKGFVEPWMYNEREIRLGLREGHYFANAKLSGAIIGYSKVGMERVYVDDYHMAVELPKRVALLYHIYVLPEHRKNNIAKYLLAKLLSELKEKDFTSMCCQIALWNKASIGLFGSLGFNRIAHVKFYRLFGVLRFWLIKKDTESRFSFSTYFSLLDL
jgi:ribosomal protein S18 acetylase RimI-like enzyme